MVQLHALELRLQQFGAAIELEAAPPKKMAKLAIIIVIRSKGIILSRSVSAAWGI
jgi:hypothetical protein